jgi:dUTP pyrophosphatase
MYHKNIFYNKFIMQTQMEINFRKLNEDAKIPTYGTNQAIGMDLSSCEDTIIEPHCWKVVKTGLAVSWCGNSLNFDDPSNYYLRIAPRSGLAVKHGIFINAGVIDFDYRGEIGVVVHNSNKETFVVSKGDRIAQCILERATRPKIREVNELTETERGGRGFGSTGVHITLN